MPRPEDCHSMTELRVAIDALDGELVAHLAARAALIDRAIALKSENGMPARIDSRVEEVVENVRTSADALGYDAALAEMLWRIIINWSIAREEQVLGAGPNRD
ncbi:MAG: chorismate mutase [Paracoccaceae bacterium]